MSVISTASTIKIAITILLYINPSYGYDFVGNFVPPDGIRMRTGGAGSDEPKEGTGPDQKVSGWIRCEPDPGTYLQICFWCACKGYICK